MLPRSRHLARLLVVSALAGAVALGVAPGLATPAPAHADTSNFTFDSFEADYTLSRDADGTSRLDVVETIVARFPEFDQNRGIIRAIPLDYDGVPMAPEVTSVTDGSGASVPFESDERGAFVELALGTDDFVRGVQTYVISYTLENVVRSFDDTASDELYWDVNGTGWGQPFGEVSVAVTLSDEIADAFTGNAACYVGPQGSTDQCPIDASATPITASATDLGPGETLSIAVGFAPDTFVTFEPPAPTPLPAWVPATGIAIIVAALAALLAAIISAVRAPGGVPRTRALIPHYTEPRGIDILQSAHLVSRPDTAIPAMLVRLAVRKNLRILAYAATDSTAPYTLQYRADAGADDLDRAALDALFGADRQQGDLKPYGEYDATLTTALTGFSETAKRSLTEQGFTERAPKRPVASRLASALWLLLTLTFAANILCAVLFGESAILLVVAGGIAGISAIIASLLMLRPQQLTQRGRDAVDHLDGLRLYLTVAEEDRLRALQSPQGAERIDVGNGRELVKLYEKLLPWAVVWGIEDQWMSELAVRASAAGETPDFFVGPDGFQAALFVTALQGFQSTMTDPAAQWSSSGAGSTMGGTFGGGFAGGGGGGGGGGGR
ncbi:putative membrane protein DUF2207 [Microcella alkaliphila]|uniref:Putative membrane protein DUF2207 n=1 Tax=Microcella alkaliphila TaxID=279828 RepID=A0A4Q7TGL8_9MICO|nr:DUF2207 domain-containing protein [Microcella alkaliphila]RZT58272.1 putative membrane protein DUF2207 [Microcella alkaliphila]